MSDLGLLFPWENRKMSCSPEPVSPVLPSTFQRAGHLWHSRMALENCFSDKLKGGLISLQGGGSF